MAKRRLLLVSWSDLSLSFQLTYTALIMRSSYLTLRRSLRHIPSSTHTRRLPPLALRSMTIQAGAPPPSDEANDPSTTNFQLVSGSSQHPFASNFSPHSSSSSSSDRATFSTGPHEGEVQEGVSVVESLPQPPPPTPPIPVIKLQHPFDTHAFVTYLEKSDIGKDNAVVLMEAVRELIVRRKTRALETMLNKEDMENVRVGLLGCIRTIDSLRRRLDEVVDSNFQAAYLFRAALSELRAELSVRAKSDSLSLKQMTLAIRRDIESLEQKIKEDVQTLKHEWVSLFASPSTSASKLPLIQSLRVSSLTAASRWT